MYYLRTNTGIMVGKVDNVTAGCMMRQCEGEWKEKKFTTGIDTVFVFTDNFTYGSDIMKFCIWEDFYLVKE
jgi:hypothetical protein